MKPKQLSLFDEPTKVRERKAGSQAATPDPKPDTKGPEPLDEEAPLVDLAVDLAGERMRKPVYLRTLDRWVEKYGEAGVRDALVNRHCTRCEQVWGPGDRHFLSRWEWKLFGPFEEVFAAVM